jgi:hypothetical protein
MTLILIVAALALAGLVSTSYFSTTPAFASAIPKAIITRTLKQGNLNGVAVGTATGKVSPAFTLLGLKLRCLTSGGVELTRAQMINDISNIRVLVDGELFKDGDVTYFLDEQKYYGDFAGNGNVNGIVPINFVSRTMPSYQERAVYALGMGRNPETGAPVGSVTIEMDVIAVAQLASVEVYAECEESVRDLGQHIKLKKHTYSFASTGDNEIDSLPKYGAGSAYKALFIRKPGSSTITKANVRVNGDDLDQNVPLNVLTVQLAERNRVIQGAYHAIDFGRQDDLGGFLPMAGVSDFRQVITWATAAPNAFTIFAEVVQGLKK